MDFQLPKLLENLLQNTEVLKDASKTQNLQVLSSLLGPALRGFILQKGKSSTSTDMNSEFSTHFNWSYKHEQPEFGKLYQAAKQSQWDGATALDWSINVDPYHPEFDLFPDELLPLKDLPAYRKLTTKEQQLQRHALLSWMLSQFLHGEQGALFAACQVTQSVNWMDGKLFASTQVADEGRHVEVFHRYLTEKLGRLYQINDNLYVIIDALITDARWDLKFLGMQIMIEGLALGAFGTMRESTKEPLLKQLLKQVILDEARHVHFGVVALRKYYTEDITPALRKEREDWAYEISLLLRNRFLAHEFYDEYYGHQMRRAEWNRFILGSDYMIQFRQKVFRRIIPNLKKIHLLSDRIRPHYESIGLLMWENEKAAPEIAPEELVS